MNVSWYSNGQQKEKGSVIKESSDNSLSFYTKRGIWTKWYINGQKSEKDHILMGRRMEYGLSGMKMAKKNQRVSIKNKKEDAWTFWYDDGNKKSKGSYENGEFNGQWTKWYEWTWRKCGSKYTAREN